MYRGRRVPSRPLLAGPRRPQYLVCELGVHAGVYTGVSEEGTTTSTICVYLRSTEYDFVYCASSPLPYPNTRYTRKAGHAIYDIRVQARQKEGEASAEEVKPATEYGVRCRLLRDMGSTKRGRRGKMQQEVGCSCRTSLGRPDRLGPHFSSWVCASATVREQNNK